MCTCVHVQKNVLRCQVRMNIINNYFLFSLFLLSLLLYRTEAKGISHTIMWSVSPDIEKISHQQNILRAQTTSCRTFAVCDSQFIFALLYQQAVLPELALHWERERLLHREHGMGLVCFYWHLGQYLSPAIAHTDWTRRCPYQTQTYISKSTSSASAHL